MVFSLRPGNDTNVQGGATQNEQGNGTETSTQTRRNNGTQNGQGGETLNPQLFSFPDSKIPSSTRSVFIESGFTNIGIRCRIRLMRVDGRLIRTEKIVD